ncbi:MAG: tyrosine-type recombinase/integrase [Steroidobacteraceae bacterium]
MPLTDAKIRAARATEKPEKLFDGGGLYLLVQPLADGDMGRRWRLKYRFRGKEKLLAIGTYPAISLREAREARDDAKKLLVRGTDPAAQKKVDRIIQTDTFKAIAEEWLRMQSGRLAEVTLGKARWIFEDFVYPKIGDRLITEIRAPELLAALRAVEHKGLHETASRAKQRVGQIFRFAIATGRAERDITADLRGALAPVVVTNRAAITDPGKVGELMRAIDGYQGDPATCTALKLAPLTFVRPGELRGAEWREFSLDGKEPEWRIPGERMKVQTREPHIVPLSRQAIAVLRGLEPLTGNGRLVFPSLRSREREMSENTLNAALRRMGFQQHEMTAHGFRAMASTLLNEQGFPPDVIELQLAHQERNKVRAAYNRATRLPERRKMMQAWADYLDGLKAGGKVMPIRRKA